MNFFEVKTTSKFSNWTLSRLSNTAKNKSSKGFFIGFLFYNFLSFDEECEKCHFVSNVSVDDEINLWQSVIEDNKLLINEKPALYYKIINTMTSSNLR